MTNTPYENRLKELRVLNGLSQKQVAALLCMQCEDRLSHWERGTAMPSVENLFKLAKLYEVNAQEIYPGLEE